MLRSYVKIIWRNLLRYKGYSAINISGLALGIAASFVLFLSVHQEKSYDTHFDHYDRIYRIASDFFNMGGFACTSPSLYRWLKEDCNEAERVTAVDLVGSDIGVEVDKREFIEDKGLAIDSSFFKVFRFEFLEGDPDHLMKSPDEIVISEELADKYFGSDAPLGKTIRVGKDKTPYVVSAVLKKDKRKSHLQADFYVPLEIDDEVNWTSASIYVYVLLHEYSGLKDLKLSLEQLRRDVIYPMVTQESTYESWSQSFRRVEYYPQQLKDIYLYSTFRFDFFTGGNPQQVSILGIIGLFLILLAMVNYINLTTARGAVRAKEIGIKKTLGANRPSIIRQFLMESVVMSLIAMTIAGGLAELLLVAFEEITGDVIIQSIFDDGKHLFWLGGFSLLTGLLAGIYPALYLTRFQPVKVISGKFKLSGNSRLRSSLVVFQFIIAASLIIGSLIVYQQLQFLKNSDKGFEQESVLIVNNADQLVNKKEAFRQEIEQYPQVVSTSFNDRIPGGSTLYMGAYKTPEMEESITVQTFPIDENYLPTLKIRLAQGRNFSKDYTTDSSALIINQSAVGALGLTGKNPIGAVVNDSLRIVGIVEDFNFQSLRETISPVILKYGGIGSRLAIKLGHSGVSDFVPKLEETWERFSPGEPIDYTFIDENFAKLAAKESMLSKAIAIFTGLAILIACLGLLGLAAFMIEQRIKELGIRKVLGATSFSLVKLLSGDFLKLIVIALIIAGPVAYYLANQWLQEFSYRINLSWWFFGVTAAIVILVAMLTVGFQSLRSALANPVESLKNE